MQQIWDNVIAQFRCDLDSIHGPEHWRRVEKNGIEIAAQTPGADRKIVRLFAVLHDSQRLNDYSDHNHGELAAQYAGSIREKLFHIDEYWFGVLSHALKYHADGYTSFDPTIGACWDADRLDLTRLGIVPDLSLLSTEAGSRMATATPLVPSH